MLLTHSGYFPQTTTFPPPSDDDTSSAPSRTGHHDQAGPSDPISSQHVQTKQNTSLNQLIHTVSGSILGCRAIPPSLMSRVTTEKGNQLPCSDAQDDSGSLR